MKKSKEVEIINICHVCSNFDSFFIDFMKEQERQGLNFRIFYFRSKERGVPKITAPNLDIRLNHNQWMRYFFYLKEKKVYDDFIKVYGSEKFDVVHAHTLFTNGYIAYKYYKKTGTPYIVSVRDTDLNVFFKYRFYLRWIGKKILLNAEKIIFISDNYKETLCQKYLSKEEVNYIEQNSEVIPNGINPFFAENINTNNDLDINILKILTVGYITKRKNQLAVCEALEILKNKGFRVKYTVVGKILDKEYFNKIKKYDFVEYISFVEKEELLLLYREANIFVMPSITETFGLTYIEAMSQKLPIIYSKGQGVDSYFIPGDVGEPVNPNDSTEIACKIEDIVNDFEVYQKHLDLKIEEFNWSKIVRSYKDIYTNLIGDN